MFKEFQQLSHALHHTCSLVDALHSQFSPARENCVESFFAAKLQKKFRPNLPDEPLTQRAKIPSDYFREPDYLFNVLSISRSDSRFIIFARLSNCFFPRARAISALRTLPLLYNESGISVNLSLSTFCLSRSI